MLERLLAVALVLSFSATGLRAADFYAGAGFGGDVEAGTFRGDLGAFADADGGSWKLFAGARFGRHLAVEIATHDLGTQLCCNRIADLGFRSTVGGYSVAALGRWPLGRFAPFLKVGVMTWEEDGEFVTLIGVTPRSADGTDPLLGAGVDVDLPARFGLRADWERYEFGAASSEGVSASILWRF